MILIPNVPERQALRRRRPARFRPDPARVELASADLDERSGDAPDHEAEVERLIALGATRVADMEEWGYEWTVLQDPEGNEFCVAETR